jgi:hypothetical protein
MADYLGPPPGVGNVRPIDPETLRVDPSKYPKFHVVVASSPPRLRSEYNPNVRYRYPMVDILPADEWYVRYKIGDLFLIVSDSYNQRQCAALLLVSPYAGCFKSPFSTHLVSDYLYAIYISPGGHISGGWKLIHNPKEVALSSDRRTYLVPLPWGNEGWEAITFQEAQ